MSNSDVRNGVRMNRRDLLRLSATAGVGLVAGRPASALDNMKTAAHQAPGNCSTPRSAIAKTQYGAVRGFLDGGVFTFKGIPYGADTGGENRWLTALIALLLLKWLHHLSKAKWSLSNLASMLRLNLFTYRDLRKWLDDPFQTPPLLPESEQLTLVLA